MFAAYGRAVTRNVDGTLTVKVDIVDERTQKCVAVQEFTAMNIGGVRALIQAELQQRGEGAEVDPVLKDAIVGKLLGSV